MPSGATGDSSIAANSAAAAKQVTVQLDGDALIDRGGAHEPVAAVLREHLGGRECGSAPMHHLEQQ